MERRDRSKLRRDGEAALAWLAFLLIGMVATAATVTHAIRKELERPQPSVNAPGLLPHRLSPAPPPLPGGPSQSA